MPNAQLINVGEVVHLVDVVSGSATTLASGDGGWDVREGGPVRLWERVEGVLDAFDSAGRPGPETFVLRVSNDRQLLQHPNMPDLSLPAFNR